MKVLVTGATGFLGRRLTERLAEDGHRVRCLCRSAERARALTPLGVDVVEGDVADRSKVRGAVEGVDVVFHAAAATGGAWSEHLRSTVRGTDTVAGQALDAGVRRLVHVSTLAVYRAGGRPPRDTIDESCALEPEPERVGHYTRAKLEAEFRIGHWRDEGLEAVVVRPGIIYGPGGRVDLPHVGWNVRDRVFVLAGTGGGLLPLVHIDDTVDALVRAAECEGAAGEAYNVVHDETVTQREYLDRCNAGLGRDVLVVPLPRSLLLAAVAAGEHAGRVLRARRGRVPTAYGFRAKYADLRFTSEKAMRQLGWRPRVPLRDGLPPTLEHHLRHLRTPAGNAEAVGRTAQSGAISTRPAGPGTSKAAERLSS